MQTFLHSGSVGEVGDILFGEKALEVAEALYIFNDERRIFRGAGEDLLESFPPGSDHIEQEILPAVAQAVHYMVYVGCTSGFAISNGYRNMMQAGAEVAHELLGGRGQFEQVIDEIGMVGAQ